MRGQQVERESEATGRRRRAGRHLRPTAVAAVAAGGALGAPARYEIGRHFAVAPGSFPWSTFWVNVSGSFALGLLLTFVLERWPPTRYARPFLAIGVLGAYTTFSTFSVEADLLFKDGFVVMGVTYVLASLATGAVAVYAGTFAGRFSPGRRRRGRP